VHGLGEGDAVLADFSVGGVMMFFDVFTVKELL
jgi:hypothetical protein